MIYAFSNSFWVLESNGIHSQILSIKNTMFNGIYDEEAIGNMQMNANSRKAMHFISLSLS